MDARSPNQGANGKVLVRLNQIKPSVRQTVARRIIRVEGLVGVPMLDMMLAAEMPRQNPELLVDAVKAKKVLA